MPRRKHLARVIPEKEEKAVNRDISGQSPCGFRIVIEKKKRGLVDRKGSEVLKLLSKMKLRQPGR